MEKVHPTARYITCIALLFSMWLPSVLSSPFTPSSNQLHHTACSNFEKGPVTLYIHGTIFPVVAKFTRHHTERRGLYRHTGPTGQQNNRASLGEALSLADSKLFPAGSFYKYYWQGELTALSRRKAAEDIYQLLSAHEGSITIIAHSHGCNVALYVADLAQKNKRSLQIERLILLAPPVQDATAQFVASNTFKRVYSLYSNADFLQVADPQGAYTKPKGSETPFLSQRIFRDAPQLTQARVLIRHRSPGHRAFINPEFFQQIPLLIEILDEAQTKGKKHIILNIPHDKGKPQEVVFAQERQPRGIDHCTCNGKHQRSLTATVKDAASHHV